MFTKATCIVFHSCNHKCHNQIGVSSNIEVSHSSIQIPLFFSNYYCQPPDHMSNVVVANGVIEVMADSLQSDIGNIELINAVLPVIAYFSLSGIDSIVKFYLAQCFY